MTSWTFAFRRVLPLTLLALTSAAPLGGCGDEPAKVAPAASASAEPTGPVLDGALGEAAADLAKGQPKNAPSGQATAGGPPPNNIFTPEAAELAHARGTPAKVELMGEGSEPRLQLGATRPEGKQDMLLVVAIASGQQQALPPMAIRLKVGEKGKANKTKPAAKPAAPEAEEAAPTDLSVVAEVTEAAVAGMPAANIPKQLSEAVAKLKGSTFQWTQGPAGLGPVSHTLSKDADEGLGIALEAAEDVLGIALVPFPAKAVGEGATWMVTDRSTSMGIDAVRYRFVKVDHVDGDRATLSVQVRRYAASDRLDLPLGPQMSSASLDRIDSQGTATLVLVPKAWVADTAEISSKLLAQLAPPGGKNPGAQPAQRMQVQLEVAGQMRSPEALAAAAKNAPAGGPGRPPGAPPGRGAPPGLGAPPGAP